MLLKIIYSLIVILTFCSTSVVADTIYVNQLDIYSNNKIIIKKDIDLNGNILFLPSNVTLYFKGGVIKNGEIVGNNTNISCKNKNQAFENIKISGSWNVPVIYSTWFKNMDSMNALKNVLALTNKKIRNRVYIADGEYFVNIERNYQSCIVIEDNTHLILNGTIKLLPNPFPNYNIIRIQGNNIMISGKGIICGDKYKHKGTNGEWGMGILISNANNVHISDITVKDCWGDCIYIGYNSSNIFIQESVLDNGRRQGISITSGNGISLLNLLISNVEGTEPQYAIAIEPNINEVVDNVLVKDIKINNCKGGIAVYGRAKNSKIGKIQIIGCKLSGISKVPISITECDTVIVEKCELKQSSSEYFIKNKNVKNLLKLNNRIIK